MYCYSLSCRISGLSLCRNRVAISRGHGRVTAGRQKARQLTCDILHTKFPLWRVFVQNLVGERCLRATSHFDLTLYVRRNRKR